MLRRLQSLLEWIASLGYHAEEDVIRFLRYSIVGTTTFAIGFVLLWFFTDILHVYYLISVAGSFIITAVLQYVVVRDWAFFGTTRPYVSGLVYYILISIAGLIFTLAALEILVDRFGFYYLLVRLVVAIFVGLWNYSANLIFNFKPERQKLYLG